MYHDVKSSVVDKIYKRYDVQDNEKTYLDSLAFSMRELSEKSREKCLAIAARIANLHSKPSVALVAMDRAYAKALAEKYSPVSVAIKYNSSLISENSKKNYDIKENAMLRRLFETVYNFIKKKAKERKKKLDSTECLELLLEAEWVGFCTSKNYLAVR